MLDKQDIRKIYLNKRKNLNEKFVSENSEIIQNKLFLMKEYLCSESICVYMDTQMEVQTNRIILNALGNNKKVAIPKIENNVMNFYYIKDISQTKLGNFKINEPITKDIVKNDNPLIIVPGIVFDKKKNRIGYGMGFYDKYLNENKNCKKIALAFDFQIVDSVPYSQNDIKMDIVITEKSII